MLSTSARLKVKSAKCLLAPLYMSMVRRNQEVYIWTFIWIVYLFCTTRRDSSKELELLNTNEIMYQLAAVTSRLEPATGWTGSVTTTSTGLLAAGQLLLETLDLLMITPTEQVLISAVERTDRWRIPNFQCITFTKFLSKLSLHESYREKIVGINTTVLVSGAGHYIYTETSPPVQKGHQAVIESMWYNPIGRSMSTTFTFWYHMYGATTGSIEVPPTSY